MSYWQGPLNVPGYSSHQYHVDSHALPAGGGWQFGDGTITDGWDTDTMKILSGAGGAVEKRVYRINDQYTWDLEVNVVEVTVEAPAVGQAFAAGTPVDNGNPVAGQTMRKYVRAGDVNPLHPGLEWGARVTLKGAGDDQRGLKFMVVGFIQNVIGYRNEGVYRDGPTLVGNKTGTMTPSSPVLDAAIGAAQPWYVFVGVPNHASKIDTWGVDHKVDEIWEWDTPWNGPPLTADQGAQVDPADDVLSSMTYLNTFSLDVCVQTKDVQEDANKVFTRRATAQWTFNGSGTVNNVDPWAWSAMPGVTGVSAPTRWDSITDGTQPKTDGKVALQQVAEETFSAQ